MFDNIKAMIAHGVCMAYSNYNEEFEIFTDASSQQFGAVIVQKNRPIAFLVEN